MTHIFGMPLVVSSAVPVNEAWFAYPGKIEFRDGRIIKHPPRVVGKIIGIDAGA